MRKVIKQNPEAIIILTIFITSPLTESLCLNDILSRLLSVLEENSKVFYTRFQRLLMKSVTCRSIYSAACQSNTGSSAAAGNGVEIFCSCSME